MKPRTLNTTNPAKKLVPQFTQLTMMASLWYKKKKNTVIFALLWLNYKKSHDQCELKGISLANTGRLHLLTEDLLL